MVSYNPKVWFSIIFHAYSRNVMKTLMPALAFITGYTAVLCYLLLEVLRFHESDFKTTIAMHSLLGIVLGLFLVFRTNSAYDRWWEGRKIWGSFVNNSRNFAIKLNAYLPVERSQDRAWFSEMIGSLAFGLKEHLRSSVALKDLALDAATTQQLGRISHVPNSLISLMYERVNGLYRTGLLNGDHLFLLDKELKEFSDIVGGCERIRNTPIPYSYTMFIKKFIFIYLITLPFAFVTTSGYITVPIVLVITYVLLSVELIAEEIEDPFGGDVNDLPTDELAVKIKQNVKDILAD